MEHRKTTNFPESTNTISTTPEMHTEQENDDTSVTSKEICTQILDLKSSEIQNNNSIPRTTLKSNNDSFINRSSLPTVCIGHLPAPITNQPLRILSNLPSLNSLNIPSSNQPQSLFIQAFAKLNESSLGLDMTDKRDDTSQFASNKADLQEIKPPDSLTSAPPSYSFVLRQMTGRRRPRLMGTFIPSPSFVQHTPPPNYATAFDIYVDNPVTPPTTRVYNFGFTPIPVACPECGYRGMTVVASKITLCTHLCAIILCLLCCWICAPLPYVLRSCKDVYHYCRNCRNFLGMYCPTNPESAYT